MSSENTSLSAAETGSSLASSTFLGDACWRRSIPIWIVSVFRRTNNDRGNTNRCHLDRSRRFGGGVEGPAFPALSGNSVGFLGAPYNPDFGLCGSSDLSPDYESVRIRARGCGTATNRAEKQPRRDGDMIAQHAARHGARSARYIGMRFELPWTTTPHTNSSVADSLGAFHSRAVVV
jgi:hypothetical protein